MERRFRAHFINSLSGFKSGSLLATANANGETNLAMISSVFHLGADPALIGLIIRPHSVPRHSLENILETGVYTLNHVAEEFFKQAHQTSANYLREESEFTQVGLTPEYYDDLLVPFVKESSVKYALKLVEQQKLKINDTIMVIGEVTKVITDPSALNSDGYLDIASLNSIAISGLDCYLRAEKLARLSYAKPDQQLKELG